MKEPKIDIKLDNNVNATIIIECPNCKKIHKKQL